MEVQVQMQVQVQDCMCWHRFTYMCRCRCRCRCVQVQVQVQVAYQPRTGVAPGAAMKREERKSGPGRRGEAERPPLESSTSERGGFRLLLDE